MQDGFDRIARSLWKFILSSSSRTDPLSDTIRRLRLINDLSVSEALTES
jgi:hypothetical protein